MPIRLVTVPTRLALVPGAGNLYQQFQDYFGRDGFPRSPDDIVHDLAQPRDGVPLTFSEPMPGKDNWSLLAYTRHYVVRLFLAGKYGDAYSIASVYPLRLRDHQRLAEGHLLVRAPGWLTVDSTRGIPPGVTSGWEQLVQAWDALTGDLAVTAPPTTPQEDFLRRLGGVIDATERIMTANEDGQRYPYGEVEPAGSKRSGASQLYDFRLAGVRAPEERAFVEVTGPARARGQVTRIDGMTVTVKFDDLVDWRDLAGQGELVTTKSGVVYRMQREAVGQLRSGKARNPGVLAALVEGRVRPPGPGGQQPGFPLNERQREAFRKALTVPDLLVVLGPPGTGKTRTITEIVRAAARAGERVIVCSQSNRAVDNVLKELPGELLAIRVGNTERITPEGQAYVLQRQAAEQRTSLLGAADRNLDAYRNLDQARGWAAELATSAAELATARDEQARAEQRAEAERRAAGGPAAGAVDRLTAAHAGHVMAAQRSAARAGRLGRRRDFAAARSAWMLIGWLLAALARRWDRSLSTERDRGEQLAAQVRAVDMELRAAHARLVEVTRDVPAVRVAAQAAADATAACGQRRAVALRAARACAEAVRPMETPPSVRDDRETAAADRQLVALSEWLAARLPLLAARRELLSGWLEEASGDSGQLEPELIRYADLVAATCTGAGSRPELAGVDFGLAIVDEAGQIGVADTLVPLVRARRAVLVGDHQQLPPFLDSDVDAWGKLAGDQTVRDLLSKSALELMVAGLPPGSENVVLLTEQRRMPEVVARWISAEFYDGQLVTPEPRAHRDRLFGSPMAFVDTSGLDWPERRDRSGRDRERWGQKGYDNPAEARLLADLAVYYAGLGAEWAVIVPYLAQAALVTRLLTGPIADTDLIRENVGSVDSFQGGQRDVILYGFTRSNPERSVGFLKELRRVNVAITRVKQQLVMVGDLDTLTQARNRRFGTLARSLRAYLDDNGEVVPYEKIRSRLGES